MEEEEDSRKEEELLVQACYEGNLFVFHTLLEYGCSAGTLSREEPEELLHHACHDQDLFIIGALLQGGCKVGILSKEEQEELLHRACHERNMFVVHVLLENGCNVTILSTKEQEELLHCTCLEGDVFVAEALLDNDCNMNCANSLGYTPLMDATEKGHEEIVKKLILAGANVGMQTVGGNTALHIAAFCNNIQCGILLAEGGASVRTKNNLAQTPLDLAKGDFQEAIKQALSFPTRKTLCIIGNAEGGKSTLIAALQAESNYTLTHKAVSS